MKVLLDECVDTRFALHLTTFAVSTVSGLRWSGITNGELLKRAESQFDVFVTVDRNLAFQQSLPKFSIAVVLIRAKSNRLADLIEIVPELVAAISRAPRGALTTVGV